ncbi:MAG: SGNH/GDSL hydrolase family protein [Gemmataceae bacterium]
MSRKAFVVLICLVFVGNVSAQGNKKDKKKRPRTKNPVVAPIKADPKLPHVLLIGDSISMGYTLPTRKLLKGKANVHRIPTNGGPTIRGVEMIDKWLGDRKWDVIHFNWGLHDLKMDSKGRHQVPLQQYKKNLSQLVERMKGQTKVLIWASTTPVPQGKVKPPRKDSDVIAYNKVAAEIMKKHDVKVNDLYSFVLPNLSKLQRPVNVHFRPGGSAALARQVASKIEAALAGQK